MCTHCLFRYQTCFCKKPPFPKVLEKIKENYLLVDLSISEIKLQKSKPKAIFSDRIFHRILGKPSIETCCLRLDIV